jgi:predicted RNA-binding Zn ribbon-like protein
MPVEWTAHRFSGGVLALDVANTVVRRDRPDLRFDRFSDAREIERFAEAASLQRAAELGGRKLQVVDGAAAGPVVTALREATDALFRDAAASPGLRPALLVPFLRAAAEAVAAASDDGDEGKPPLRFETGLGLSALSLLAPEMRGRIRICPNCAWLFLDRSRNRSRTWCDMAVCGNRRKAQRHYRRLRKGEAIDG